MSQIIILIYITNVNYINYELYSKNQYLDVHLYFLMETVFFLHGFSIIKDIRIVQIEQLSPLVPELNAIPRKACRANFQTDKTAPFEIRGTIRPGSWPANRHRRLCRVSRVKNVSIVVAVIQLVRIEKRGGTSITRLTSLILFLLSSIIARDSANHYSLLATAIRFPMVRDWDDR